MRIVLDTNVLVSAILSPHGKPARILRLVLEGKAVLILSRSVLAETERVLRYPKLRRLLKRKGISLKEVHEFLKKLTGIAVLAPDQTSVNAVSEDPSDNMFLACAVEGQADFIISGDQHLTALGTFQGIMIVDPAEFLRLIAS